MSELFHVHPAQDQHRSQWSQGTAHFSAHHLPHSPWVDHVSSWPWILLLFLLRAFLSFKAQAMLLPFLVLFTVTTAPAGALSSEFPQQSKSLHLAHNSFIVCNFYNSFIGPYGDSQIDWKLLKNSNNVLYLFIDCPSSWHRAHASWWFPRWTETLLGCSPVGFIKFMLLGVRSNECWVKIQCDPSFAV